LDPELVLYTIPGSHACRSATLMLEHKGLGWRERRLPAGTQRMLMRAFGFPGRTVPAIKVNDSLVQTNRRIARFLDELRPEPPLVPAGREDEIEDAERFTDEILQPLARRLLFAAARRDLAEISQRGDDGRLGTLLAPNRAQRRMVVRLGYWFFDVGTTEKLDREALPGVLDHLDRLVARGSLNADSLTAADFETAPCIALLGYRRDLTELVASHPSWRLVQRLLPEPGR
jgi:glutathione S-transferase